MGERKGAVPHVWILVRCRWPGWPSPSSAGWICLTSAGTVGRPSRTAGSPRWTLNARTLRTLLPRLTEKEMNILMKNMMGEGNGSILTHYCKSPWRADHILLLWMDYNRQLRAWMEKAVYDGLPLGLRSFYITVFRLQNSEQTSEPADYSIEHNTAHQRLILHQHQSPQKAHFCSSLCCASWSSLTIGT